jgi:hypothetical protein
MTMTATKGATGSGVTLSIATPGTGETFVSILQARSISWTQPKLQTADSTCLSSPTLGGATVKEYLGTLIEPGALQAEAIYLPSDSGLEALDTAFKTGGAVRDFKIQFPAIAAYGQTTSGNLYTFSGIVLEQPLPDGISVDKITPYKVSVQITTPITVTIGS